MGGRQAPTPRLVGPPHQVPQTQGAHHPQRPPHHNRSVPHNSHPDAPPPVSDHPRHTTARGGPGLGLIAMARRSGQALGNRTVAIDAHRSPFVLPAALAQPGARTDEESQAIDRDLGLHQQAIAMGLLVAMRFDGNAAAQETLLRILSLIHI